MFRYLLHIATHGVIMVNRCTHWYWSVGYASGPKSTTAAKLCRTILKRTGTEVHSRHFHIHAYNVRPSAELVRQGFRRRVQESQGQEGVWYTGGLCSHWDVDSIYEHVEQLVGEMKGPII